MHDKKIKIRNVLNKCFTSDGVAFPANKDHTDITRYQLKSYVSDKDLWMMEIYIRSDGSGGNNTPYVMDRKLSIDRIVEFRNMVSDVVENDSNSDDMYGDTALGQPNEVADAVKGDGIDTCEECGEFLIGGKCFNDVNCSMARAG